RARDGEEATGLQRRRVRAAHEPAEEDLPRLQDLQEDLRAAALVFLAHVQARPRAEELLHEVHRAGGEGLTWHPSESSSWAPRASPCVAFASCWRSRNATWSACSRIRRSSRSPTSTPNRKS